MTRRRRRPITRERIPWALGLLAISVVHVANGNGWRRQWTHLPLMLERILSAP